MLNESLHSVVQTTQFRRPDRTTRPETGQDLFPVRDHAPDEGLPWTQPRDIFEASSSSPSDAPGALPGLHSPSRPLVAPVQDVAKLRSLAGEQPTARFGTTTFAPLSYPRLRSSLASRQARRGAPALGIPVDADPRLLSAPPWSSLRVHPVRTDSPIVKEAQRHLGRAYRWGGTNPEGGVDCSGFAWSVYRRLRIPVPLAWFRAPLDPRVDPRRLEHHGMRWVRSPRPGDVAVFGRQHVGLYVGQVQGRALYVGANHGGRGRRGRVDLMPVSSVRIRPVYYRWCPERSSASPPASKRWPTACPSRVQMQSTP